MELDEIKKLLARAEKNGWTKAEIARQIKTKRATLNSLLGRESPKSKIRPRLVKWLEAHADTIYRIEDVDAAPDQLSPREAAYIIADELEALVGVLRARELPEEYKASRLASWVSDAHRDLVGKDRKQN